MTIIFLKNLCYLKLLFPHKSIVISFVDGL